MACGLERTQPACLGPGLGLGGPGMGGGGLGMGGLGGGGGEGGGGDGGGGEGEGLQSTRHVLDMQTQPAVVGLKAETTLSGLMQSHLQLSNEFSISLVFTLGKEYLGGGGDGGGGQGGGGES